MMNLYDRWICGSGAKESPSAHVSFYSPVFLDPVVFFFFLKAYDLLTFSNGFVVICSYASPFKFAKTLAFFELG